MAITSTAAVRRIEARRSRYAGGAAAAIAAAAAVCLWPTGAHAATSPTSRPFDCTKPTVFVSEGGQLETQSYGAGSTSFTDVGTQGVDYNAIGLDPQDDYLYGVGYGNGGVPDGALFRIDSTGAATDLGAITEPAAGGIPIGQQNNAAFDASGAMYVYNFANGTTSTNNDVLYKVDVAQHTATGIKLLGPDVPTTSDVAFIGSDLWGYAYDASGIRNFARIDPTSGQVTLFPTTLDIPSADFMGAAWTYGNGDLGFEDDSTGVAYQVAISAPDSAAPGFRLVSQYAGPNEGGLDGAACGGTEADLALRKTGTSPVAPASRETFTLSVTDRGPGSSSGYVIQDAVPAGFSDVTTTSPGCVVSANDVRCAEGALPSGSSAADVTVVATAPSTSGTCLTNSATVTGNEKDPVTRNDTSSFRVCTTGGASSSPTRSAPASAPTSTQPSSAMSRSTAGSSTASTVAPRSTAATSARSSAAPSSSSSTTSSARAAPASTSAAADASLAGTGVDVTGLSGIALLLLGTGAIALRGGARHRYRRGH